MEVNIGIVRVGLEGLLEVVEAQHGVFFRVLAKLDVKGGALDEGVGSGNNKIGD